MYRSTIVTWLAALCLVAAAAPGRAEARVSINGSLLTPVQVQILERQIGGRIAPGDYLVGQNGCWVNLSSGARGCLQGNFEHWSRYGSGERSGDGSWNHWSDAADGAVGGTADGCVYTTYGWSNC